MSHSLRFLMIVDDPAIARFSGEHGVDRLFVDLERLGKNDRQKHVQSWKSHQTPEDVTRIREAAPDSHLLVRLNPVHDGSRAEVDDAIDRGVDSLMLPMFQRVEELAQFFEMVRGRVRIVPLFETAASLQALPTILDTLPVDELHIGLNDLHLDLGDRFMFEPIANGVLEEPCALLRERRVPFGIGGVARAGEGIIAPEFLLGEHVRLGSDCAILSRSFHRNATTLDELLQNTDFDEEVAKLQAIYRGFLAADTKELEANRQRTAHRIRDVVHVIAGG